MMGTIDAKDFARLELYSAAASTVLLKFFTFSLSTFNALIVSWLLMSATLMKLLVRSSDCFTKP